jgi:hypothetical protein
MRSEFRPRALVLWALLLGACAPDRGGVARSRDPGDPIGGPDPGDLSVSFDGGYSDKCGVQNFTLQKGLPPEVMIVLDRSDSMSTSFGSGTRWSEVTNAVEQVVAALQGMIGWGLTVFPSDDNCGTSANVDVTVAAMNSSAIAAKISSYMPGGNTPTAAAVKQAAAYMASRTTMNPKYLLLSTDGEPNCGTFGTTCICLLGTLNSSGQCCDGATCYGPCLTVPTDDGAQKAVQAVTDAASAGVHTFVIGVSADSGDDASLNQLATAGQEPRAGATKYYAVGSQADLISAVNAIAGQIISCSFALSSTPPGDPSLVEVDVDSTQVVRDPSHMNGWDFGPGNLSIVFYGAACAGLQMGSGSMVQAIYKCPPTL